VTCRLRIGVCAGDQPPGSVSITSPVFAFTRTRSLADGVGHGLTDGRGVGVAPRLGKSKIGNDSRHDPVGKRRTA